jgi:hypothetical protein
MHELGYSAISPLMSMLDTGQSREYLDAHRDEQMARAEMPRLAAAVFDHSRIYLQVDATW